MIAVMKPDRRSTYATLSNGNLSSSVVLMNANDVSDPSILTHFVAKRGGAMQGTEFRIDWWTHYVVDQRGRL